MAPDAPAVLEFRGVSKSFGGPSSRVDALFDVSFELQAGEFAVLMGPSGSGKSTLLHLAAGLEQPSAGSVHVAGSDLAGLDDERLARLRCETVSLVFQAFHLVDDLTAEENVALPLRFAGLPARAAAERAQASLSVVDLASRSRHRPAVLSGGEMQRVAIARALATRPRLLLADEPTGNLDSRTGAEVLELLRAINEREGVAILLATHDERASRSAPRLFELRDGALASDAQKGPRHPRASGASPPL